MGHMNIGHLHVTACRRLDLGGEIACSSSTKGVRSVGSVSPQEDIHRNVEKDNELLYQLIESVMCLEWILHVSPREVFLCDLLHAKPLHCSECKACQGFIKE